MRRLTLLLTLLGIASMSSPALAQYQGQRPAGETIDLLAEKAHEFWAARDVTGCDAGITAYRAESLADLGDTGEHRGRGGDCTIWISESEADELDSPEPTRATMVNACAVVYHEVGHALGLGHTPTGLMSEVGDPPWDCQMWARPRLTAYAAVDRVAAQRRVMRARVRRERSRHDRYRLRQEQRAGRSPS